MNGSIYPAVKFKKGLIGNERKLLEKKNQEILSLAVDDNNDDDMYYFWGGQTLSSFHICLPL